MPRQWVSARERERKCVCVCSCVYLGATGEWEQQKWKCCCCTPVCPIKIIVSEKNLFRIETDWEKWKQFFLHCFHFWNGLTGVGHTHVANGPPLQSKLCFCKLMNLHGCNLVDDWRRVLKNLTGRSNFSSSLQHLHPNKARRIIRDVGKQQKTVLRWEQRVKTGKVGPAAWRGVARRQSGFSDTTRRRRFGRGSHQKKLWQASN